MPDKTPTQQLAAFLAKFGPRVAAAARAALARLRERLPGAIELVYDNYNALAAAKKPLDPKQRRRLITKSVSAKQRPRRP